ncbi:hypothetical protein AURDEDRAFT_114278 [Auricularia subglabra TFB-10046 SS5]|nr:hypothetical protein AURDEDRAFT_114278 [Auricularia subglabra TFB-10046 SS5]
MKDTSGPPSPHQRFIDPGTLAGRRSRHITRACAVCRRRKTKCDGVEPACGTCTVQGQECVWSQEPDKRKTRDAHLAIDDLRDKVAKLEQQVRWLSPGVDSCARLTCTLRTPSHETSSGPVEVTCVIYGEKVPQVSAIHGSR